MMSLKRSLPWLAALSLSCSDSTGPTDVARVELDASDSTLAVTDSAMLYLTAFNAAGDELVPTDGRPTIEHATLSAVPTGVVSVSGATVVAVGRGTAQVSATINGKQDRVTFVVNGFAHNSEITANETWRAADNPHYVRRAIHVGAAGPVTLTLEPGAQLRFELRGGLVFDRPGAVLHAVGTPSEPISLTADSAAVTPENPIKGFWSGVLIASSQSDLRHVVMSDCARDTYLVLPYFGACLVLAGLFGDDPAPVLQNVTIKDFGITAVLAQNGGGFGAASGNLTITGGGPFYFGGGGLPIYINANEVGTIPATTTLSGNQENRIRVGGLPGVGGQPGIGDSVVRGSQTWLNFGVPYYVQSTVVIAGVNAPVLRLAPGVQLQFDRFTGVLVGRGAPGGLVAVGTSLAPVVFTSPDTFKYGHSWNGVLFGTSLVAGSRLAYAVVEAGGGFNATFQWAGEVVVEQNGLDSLITNSTIRRSGECGIVRAWPPAASNTDYTLPALGNTFADNRRGDQCGP